MHCQKNYSCQHFTQYTGLIKTTHLQNKTLQLDSQNKRCQKIFSAKFAHLFN